MTITIPTCPPSINKVLRMHWTSKRNLRAAWILLIRSQMGPPKPVPKTKMRVTITLHNSKAYDRDNAFGACKVIFDAMKTLGLIFDDRPQFLDAEVKQEKSSRAAKYTVIQIEACA